MDAPQPQKSSVDYISNLPADTKEKILIKLSLKEVVRTSILSSRWKDSWTSIPNLIFEENSTESVDQVLLVHQGSIQKFKLFSEHACNEAIGRWMLILSRNGIEDLDLVFTGGDCDIVFSGFALKFEIDIPSCFFSCIALKFVHLSGCNINVPQFFNGFPLLNTLHLSNFYLSVSDIEKLVSSCHLLENLKLHSFAVEGCLHILAPNLIFLDINGDFHDICLETPKLVSGGICLGADVDYSEFSAGKDGKTSNNTRAFGHLSNIRKLKYYLSMGPIPENLSAIFNHLTELYVELGIFPKEIMTTLCLFHNAPNLQFLHMQLWLCHDRPPHVQGLWESKAIRDCLFKRLEVVNIMYERHDELCLIKAKSMLEFAELVLSTAPLLEEFNVTDLGNSMVIFEELKFFPKLSEKCKIVLVE